MMSLVVAEESPTGPAGRIGLRYFSLYRLALATLFLILVWNRGLPAPLGTDHPALFGTVAHVYFGLAVLAQIALWTRAAPESAQVLAQVLLDIAAVTLFMYASGGVGSGFGTLLVVSIAIGGLLTKGRIAYPCAGFATCAVLTEELCRWLDSDLRAADYTRPAYWVRRSSRPPMSVTAWPGACARARPTPHARPPISKTSRA